MVNTVEYTDTNGVNYNVDNMSNDDLLRRVISLYPDCEYELKNQKTNDILVCIQNANYKRELLLNNRRCLSNLNIVNDPLITSLNGINLKNISTDNILLCINSDSDIIKIDKNTIEKDNVSEILQESKEQSNYISSGVETTTTSDVNFNIGALQEKMFHII